MRASVARYMSMLLLSQRGRHAITVCGPRAERMMSRRRCGSQLLTSRVYGGRHYVSTGHVTKLECCMCGDISVVSLIV